MGLKIVRFFSGRFIGFLDFLKKGRVDKTYRSSNRSSNRSLKYQQSQGIALCEKRVASPLFSLFCKWWLVLAGCGVLYALPVMAAANSAPTITLISGSGSNFKMSDVPLVIKNGSQKLVGLSIGDTDGDNQTVTLTVTNGTVSLSGTNGLSITTGDGTDDASMEFSGTLADINVALNNLVFKPTMDYTGRTSFKIELNDGNGGTALDFQNVYVTDFSAITCDAVTDDSGSFGGTNESAVGRQTIGYESCSVSPVSVDQWANEDGRMDALTKTDTLFVLLNTNTTNSDFPDTSPNVTGLKVWVSLDSTEFTVDGVSQASLFYDDTTVTTASAFSKDISFINNGIHYTATLAKDANTDTLKAGEAEI